MPYKDKRKINEYQKEWIRNRRKNWFKNKSCVHCGSLKHLEIDHVKPNNKISHRIWSYSEEKRNLELSKCQVLCRNCHLNKTVKDGSNKFLKYIYKHGTYNMYDRHKCRCEKCREFKKVTNKKYRDKQKLKGRVDKWTRLQRDV